MTSLQPGILPSPADLLQAMRFAIVVVLTCGIGLLAGARRLETALFTGWGIGCLVLTAAGCLTHGGLAPAATLLATLGLAGIATRLAFAKWVPFYAACPQTVTLRVLALGAPMLLILLSLRTTAYDDFSFWAPNLVALCLTGHFPVAAQPLAGSLMPGYPRGVAFSGYATWLLRPDASPSGIMRLLATGAWWNVLVLLAAAAALANALALRLKNHASRTSLWAIAGLALLLQSFLDPGFISKMTLSNMGDGATGSGLAMLTALLFELAATAAPARIIIELAATATAIVSVRQDNFLILLIFAVGVALGLVLWRGAGRLRRVAWLAVAAIPAMLTWLIWTRYAAAQIPGGAHSLLAPRNWHWAEYHYTLQAAGRVLLSKGVYTLLAIGFGIAFLAMPVKRAAASAAEKLLLSTTAALVFGNAAFIMFTYLATSFTQVEVRSAVTFWRFLAQTAPAEMVALACLAPFPDLQWFSRSRAAALGTCLIAAALPVALLATPYTFRTDLRFPTPVFLNIGQSLATVLPAGAELTLIDNSDGSGYVARIIEFGLLDLSGAKTPVQISLQPQLVPQSRAEPETVPPGDYVLVTQSQWRPPFFLNTPMQPWHAYLFHGSTTGLLLLQDWPIPRYGRKY